MQLEEAVVYDETSPSCLRWVSPRSNRVKAGDVAGSFNKNLGYWQINVLGRLTYNHIVIAKLFGIHSDGLQVDHINRDKSDNRIANIRVVTQRDNLLNKGVRKDSSSGVTGVNWNKIKNSWQVRITTNGKTKSLGYFPSLLDAVAARLLAAKGVGYAT